MKCSEEKVGSWIDGELDAIETRAVEEHFVECSSCRDLQRRWSSGDERMRRGVEPENWNALRESILKKVVARRRTFIPLSMAASFLTAAISVIALRPVTEPAVPALADTVIPVTEDPKMILVSGEAMIRTVLDAPLDRPEPILIFCNTINRLETPEQMNHWAAEFRHDPEIADGYRLLGTVYQRLGQVAHASEISTVQVALRQSDALSRLANAQERLVMRAKQ